MERAYYDERPSALEAVGNGSYLYRWDIKEETVPSMGMGDEEQAEDRTQWSCREVTVWAPITADKLKEAVISASYGEDEELKLVNEYNSYQLGVSGNDNSEAYKAFLKERTELKRGVDEALDAFNGIKRSDADELAAAKEKKILEIYEYDNSQAVNNCYISYGGAQIPYWADKYERNCLKNSLRDCIAKGITTYRLDLRDAGVSVEVDCEKLLDFLADLEVYAIQCFNRTSDHVFAVRAISTTADEVDAYEVSNGYPDNPIYEL